MGKPQSMSPHEPERQLWPPDLPTASGRALNRLGANLWPCCLCDNHFRRDPFSGQPVHCVTAKEFKGGSTPPTDLKWDYRYHYLITYACSNRCAWWYSQRLRQYPEMYEVRVHCYRYVGTERQEVLP